ncbi:MAG: fibronectin type III domain-containing protein [Spirochaetaceae bacterium]|jgi:hypothetical protein|nr:fibronectin type III domain-containing protein [Spirochaetaceae bacterium]
MKTKKRVILLVSALLLLLSGCGLMYEGVGAGEKVTYKNSEDSGNNVPVASTFATLIVRNELTATTVRQVGLSSTGPGDTPTSKFSKKDLNISYGQEVTYTNIPTGTFYFYGADTNTTSGGVYISSTSHLFEAGKTVKVTLTGYQLNRTSASYEDVSASSGGSATVSAPTGVKAVALSSSKIQVSWNAVSGAIGYGVYANDTATGEYGELGFTYETTCTVSEIYPSQTVYFKVTAMDEDGMESEKSAYAYATTPSY